MVNTGTTVVKSPTRKPAAIAASSAQALIRHQNHRKISTTPGPVPMAITRRKTVVMSWAKKAAVAPSAVIKTEAMRPAATSCRCVASGRMKRR